MPIVETNPRRAFEKFEGFMENVVREVLPLPQPIKLALKSRDDAGVLEFVRGGIGTAVPVETKFGTLYLSLNQGLIAVREGRHYRLRTRRYQYKLLPSDHPSAEALLRWEFDADSDDGAHCRNHMHINCSLPVGHGTLPLGRAHLPTAWVLIEHVLRFLFHDLQVAARCHDWPDKLRSSETKFYEEFTSKRYRFKL